MNIHPRTGDIEEEWIVKYRAALAAVPIEQRRATRIRAVLDKACSVVISHIGKIVGKWMRTLSLTPYATLERQLENTEQFRTISKKLSRTRER